MVSEQTKYARSQKIGGLKRWVAALFGLNREPFFDPAENTADRDAERAAVLAIYQKTQRAYMAAVSNGDTREIGRRFPPMQAALHAKIRAGL